MSSEQKGLCIFGKTEIDDQIAKHYKTSDNYKERLTGSHVLYIFFSSQGLWNVSDANSFSQRVIRQDYYDYANVTQTKFFTKRKVDSLFIRDIYLSWYAYGINEQISSQSALTAFLTEKAKAYDEVVTVGSSAGGYAAILFGTQINADRIFVFGPQNDLAGHLAFYKDSSAYSYFDVDSGKVVRDLSPLIDAYTGKLYYFYADKAKVDQFQYSCIKDAPCVVAFPIASEEHGRTLLAENMLDVISSKDKKLKRLAESIKGKGIGSVAFCLRSAGLFRFTAIMTRKVYRTIFSKGPVL